MTVIVSSHLLDEIDRMAGVLGVLSAGRLVFQGTRAQLMERSVPDLLVVTPAGRAALSAEVLAGLVPASRPGAAVPTAKRIYELQNLCFRSMLINGDALVMMPVKPIKGVPYNLRAKIGRAHV